MARVNIEVKNRHGQWIKITECSEVQTSIHQNLKRAVDHPLATETKHARATDQSGTIIDMHFG